MDELNFDRRLHAHLIGRQGSRADLNTPVLVLDLDALERNIVAMAETVRGRGVRLKPHAKTHKCVEIARRQVAAGAAGQCCAKLGEAEALADGGVSGLHITSPVVSAPAIARLIALNGTSDDLSVVADSPDNVADLARAASPERPLQVVVDVDPGLHRTGVTSPEAAVALARQIAESAALRYAGVQFYCGAHQHIAGYAERRAAMAERTAYLASVVEALRAAGLEPPLVTGSGTGAHRIDLELGVMTELQPGSYVFMDDQYGDCELAEGAAAPFERSLFVDTRVVSANTSGLVTVDGGLKAFATEGKPPRIAAGAPQDARVVFMGDEHCAVIAPDIEARLRIGDLVRLSPPHCDPTVNLYAAYHVVRGDTLVDIWPVSARGRGR